MSFQELLHKYVYQRWQKSAVQQVECIQVSSARYGQISIYNRCFTVCSLFFKTCFIDMLETADSWCSGRQACNVSNDESEMIELLDHRCPPLFLWPYIEMNHLCVEGMF